MGSKKTIPNQNLKMYFLATICLLNFLTVRGTDDKDKTFQQKYAEKFAKDADLTNDTAYETCQTNYKTKTYTDKTKWDENSTTKAAELKKNCFKQEELVCEATNDKVKKFIAGLKGDEKAYCTDSQRAAVLECKAMLIGNKDCKADCDKLSTASSASSLTTTVLLALTAFAFVSM